MPKIVVHVMPKPEILDPQGKAIGSALQRLGITGIDQVRQGKRFELTVEGEVTDEVLAAAQHAAETLLSNPVIEDVVSVKVQGEGGHGHGHGGGGCACGGHGKAHGHKPAPANGAENLMGKDFRA